MTSRERSFYWKIGYVVGICVLVWPLFILGRPATDKKAGGGVLAQLRREHGLSEADLGEIDPAGETIKLASLGLTNVAANILWEKANEYKMKKDWTNLSATLQQIAKLQPHFISVWKFQAWNLSYNVSAEFDDYKDRYRWVIKGIDFLMEGIDKNDREPRLYWDQGWFTAQKIGRSDEHVQFRRLFRNDDDFHASLPPELRDPTRDNWLCGKRCFKEAERLDAMPGVDMKGMSPLVFHSDKPMCQINYAEALEDDGTFGEVAETAWRQAAREWNEYGSLDIPTTYRDPRTGDDLSIHLNDREFFQEQARKRVEKLEALAPGLREKIAQEKRDALPEKERQALDTPVAERNEKQYELAAAAAEKTKVSHEEVAERVTGSDYAEALELADEASKDEQSATYVNRYRQIVNFEYWRLRCRVEQALEAIAARKAIHEGRRAANLDLNAAREAFDDGLAKWRKVLDKFPELLEDQTTGEDLIEVIDRYKALLGKRDEKMPEPFVLQDVLDKYGKKKP